MTIVYNIILTCDNKIGIIISKAFLLEPLYELEFSLNYANNGALENLFLWQYVIESKLGHRMTLNKY